MTMITTLEQALEHYFGELLQRFNFQRVFHLKNKSAIYQAKYLRLRVTEERADTNIHVGGLQVKLDATDELGWISVFQMLDFLEDRRSVAHLFDGTFDAPHDQIMFSIAKRLEAQMPALLTWFRPEGLAERMKQLADYDRWQSEEIKRYRRAGKK
jgi:hypothetical protein